MRCESTCWQQRFCPEEDMEEVRGKYVSPAIDQLAFNCPHCDALARQFWFSVHADPLKADEKPLVATAETVKTLTFGNNEEAQRDRKLTWAEQMARGRPFLEVHREFRNRDVQNVEGAISSTRRIGKAMISRPSVRAAASISNLSLKLP